jgi:hypothetical protein
VLVSLSVVSELLSVTLLGGALVLPDAVLPPELLPPLLPPPPELLPPPPLELPPLLVEGSVGGGVGSEVGGSLVGGSGTGGEGDIGGGVMLGITIEGSARGVKEVSECFHQNWRRNKRKKIVASSRRLIQQEECKIHRRNRSSHKEGRSGKGKLNDILQESNYVPRTVWSEKEGKKREERCVKQGAKRNDKLV